MGSSGLLRLRLYFEGKEVFVLRSSSELSEDSFFRFLSGATGADDSIGAAETVTLPVEGTAAALSMVASVWVVVEVGRSEVDGEDGKLKAGFASSAGSKRANLVT
jgi:hypothetical protein